MRIDDLPKIEADFAKNLTDSDGKKFTAVTGTFPYTKLLKLPNPVHYIAQARKKTRLVSHHTCGTIKSDIAVLTKSKVSTAFVVARDGTAYQLFDPQFCAYHLGPSNDGSYSNTDMSFTSIAIEISNLGPLKLTNGVLYDIYGKAYCLESDHQSYDKVSFRGYDYYASFTQAQYDTVKKLVNDLCQKYSIPKTIQPLPQRLQYGPKQAQLVGISSHINWRKDKVDLPPNFDFAKIGL